MSCGEIMTAVIDKALENYPEEICLDLKKGSIITCDFLNFSHMNMDIILQTVQNWSIDYMLVLESVNVTKHNTLRDLKVENKWFQYFCFHM